jgi:co-chaperonin GroES (HSP10)
LRAFELADKQSRLHLPDAVTMNSAACERQGIVVAIGADCWNGEREHPRAKVGDKVMVTQYAGGVIKGADGFIYKMIPDHSIYAVLETENG